MDRTVLAKTKEGLVRSSREWWNGVSELKFQVLSDFLFL